MAQDDMKNLLILCWFSAEYFFALFPQQMYHAVACLFRCSLSFAESEDYGNSKETVSAVQWCLWLKLKQQLATLHLL